MGLCINLDISNTVTVSEWERAYQKSVMLMEKMPFIETTIKEYYGVEMRCLTKTVERECDGEMGWMASGDSDSMQTAEGYFLPKELTTLKETREGVDPYMSILTAFGGTAFRNYTCYGIIELWGSKMQGLPYCEYLLAVACTLEHELPGKVVIYGDVTREQFQEAVQIASDLLGEEIELPDRCDEQRLWARIKKMPLQEDEKVKAFNKLYMWPRYQWFDMPDKNPDEEYDISYVETLMVYEKGNVLDPSLDKLLMDSFAGYREMLNGVGYQNLLKEGAENAIRYLIEDNWRIFLLDKTWEKIFKEIEDDITSMERYYPIAEVDFWGYNDIHIVRALVSNDELYRYCLERFAGKLKN